MKKSTHLFLTLLLLLGSTWAGAQELSVKVASDRAAVLNVVDTAGDPEVSGTVKGSANLKEGKSGLRADLTLKNAAELQGAQADLYANMTGTTIEAIGYLNVKLPPDPTAPKVLDVDMKTVTEGDQSAANFKINFEGPMGPDPVPKGSGSFKVDGDFKAFKSSGDFEFSGGGIKGSDIPFSKFELTITETGAGDAANPTKTSIAFTIAAPKGSDMATQFASLPQMAPMLEQQLKDSGVKYEGLSFPAPVDEGTSTVAKGALTLIDLRGTIKPFMPMVAAQMQGTPYAQKALEDLIEVRMDKLAFTMEVQEAALKGTVGLDVSNLAKFFAGYLALLPAIQEASNQQMLAEAGEFGPILAPLLKLNTEQAVESIKLLSSSSMTIKGDMKFNLDLKGAEGDANKTMAFGAEGQMSSTNYQDYVEKAKAAGLPVAEKAVGKLTLNLKDQTTMTGDAYLYTDGDIINYYKGMLAKAAKEAQVPEDVQKAITDLALNDLGVKFTLKDNKMTILSRSSTSDLTKIAALIIKQGAPQFAAELTGGAVDVAMDDKGGGKADVKFFFSNFLPGKDAAAIKEVLGLPATANVTMDAPAADVALVAVEQPELVVDGNLARVQEDGKKLLASSPSDVASGGGGGGGGGKMGLIALGVLLLVGVGGFLAFGKKS
jgi:hypothetical protein